MRLKNSWPPEFSKVRHVRDDRTELESKKELCADGDELEIFFTDSGDTASPYKIKVLKDFCKITDPEQKESFSTIAKTLRSIWVDDRSAGPGLESGGQARMYENPLTATGLLRAWSRPRFNDETLPNASRRLVCITDLNPVSIQALAATASCHQTSVLREAIHKHLIFQTAIAIKVPSSGFLMFQLELHLPFFLVRDAPPEQIVPNRNRKSQRSWTDLSFLQLDTRKSGDRNPKETWGIFEAQFSCVVTGWDDRRWVGYGFVDPGIDDPVDRQSDDDLSFDAIVGGGHVRADMPIWQPRDYWIKVFETRIELILNHWVWLIYRVKLSIDQYRNEHQLAFSEYSASIEGRATETRKAVDWTQQTCHLLGRLDRVLTDTTEAWRTFNLPNGDVGYLEDTNLAAISSHATRSLRHINATFQQLQGHQKTLGKLKECCADFQRALELRLIMESKATADQNGITSEFAFSVFYPIALAAAIFSMQPDVIPFDQSPKCFVVVVIILIAVVHIIRTCVRRLPLPYSLFLSLISLWIRNKRPREVDEKPSNGKSGKTFRPTKGVFSHSVLTDPEEIALEALGTSTTLGLALASVIK